MQKELPAALSADNLRMHIKKSQSMSINTIIIAAIALVVLVILIAIFSNKFNIFGKETSKTESNAKSKVCWSKPGYCTDADCKPDYTLTGGDWVDCGEGQVCCVKP